MPALERKPYLKIHIVAPSAYDDQGTLKQNSRLLMLTPTYAILDGIIKQAARELGVKIAVTHHNERLERGEGYLHSIIKDKSVPNKLVIFNTKSFELPRAVDAAGKLQATGVRCALGGPGITLADLKVYRYFIQEGISFNVGEGEHTLPQMIQDAIDNCLRPAYWQRGFVDMRKAPLPIIPDKKEFKGILTRFAGLDQARGCPFGCSYCSVRKFLGSNTLESRCRLVDQSIAFLAEAYEKGYPVMITDDNIRKAFTYPEFKKAAIELSEEAKRRGWPVRLFGQSDVEATIIDEIPEMAAMGFKNLFFGFETKDKLVLARARKKQNNPERYQLIADTCRANGIAVSTGRMVDFPEQTPQSIQEETKEFCELADNIYNYLVTALPGTDDYFEAARERQLTTWDLNNYDGAHPVRDWYENMTAEGALAAYHQTLSDSCPLSLRDSIKNLIKNKFQPLDTRTLSRSYGKLLAELGSRFYGRPFHPMMDGIPHFPLPWGRVKRSADGFRGFAQDPDDPAYQSPKANKQHKEEYLSRVAWSPQAATA